MVSIAKSSFTIVVAGIGNPLLRDDTAGLHAIAAVERRLLSAGICNVVCKELFCGGFDLLSELASFSRAIIIDCLCDGETMPGEYKRFSVSVKDLQTQNHRPLAAGHGIDLAAVLMAGASCGYDMPDPVIVYGIGAADVTTFDEKPSELVLETIERVADKIFEEINLSNYNLNF